MEKGEPGKDDPDLSDGSCHLFLAESPGYEQVITRGHMALQVKPNAGFLPGRPFASAWYGAFAYLRSPKKGRDREEQRGIIRPPCPSSVDILKAVKPITYLTNLSQNRSEMV